MTITAIAKCPYCKKMRELGTKDYCNEHGQDDVEVWPVICGKRLEVISKDGI